MRVGAVQMRAARRFRSTRFAPCVQFSISTIAMTAVALFLLVLQFALRSSPKHRISLNRKSLDSLVSNIAAEEIGYSNKVSDTRLGKKSSSDWHVGETAELSNGVSMPRLGFGTAGLGPETEVAVAWAIEAGYRLIDSAQAKEWYREAMVGSAINHSSVPRDSLFLVSKDSLRELDTSYLDLFLLHYPSCFPAICPEGTPLSTATWQDSWQALEEMYEKGLIRSIGVSNFGKEEMRSLLAMARIRPHVLQSHSDPLQSNAALREFCRQQGIQYMGYSTLGSQWQFKGKATPGENPVLSHPVITRVANTRGCSTAQVVLKWAMCDQQVVIPRSHDRKRIESNLKALECGLTSSDLDEISRLDGTHPDAA